MKRLAVVMVILAWFAAPAMADDDTGIAAYKRGDYATALKEWRPLAEQGDASAQVKLGILYIKGGQGVPQDYAEAQRWFRRGAEQGHAFAQFSLGMMSEDGKGMPQDNAEAVRWYRKAAEQGDGGAQFRLGQMYGAGEGIPQDYVLAHMWYNLAAAQGAEGASKLRNLLSWIMTPAQIAEAQKLAREWKPKK